MTEIKKVTTFNHKTKKNATENRCFVSEQWRGRFLWATLYSE